MSKLTALFYPFATREQMGALKVATLYFDDVYVLTPISVVEARELMEQYRELTEELLHRYQKSLGLVRANQEIARDESVRTALEFHQEVKALIDTNVVHVVNPFDIMKGVGLEKEFRKVIDFRAQQWGQLAKNLSNLVEPEHRESISIMVSALPTMGEVVEDVLLQAESEAINAIMYDSAVLLRNRIGGIPITGTLNCSRSFVRQAVGEVDVNDMSPFSHTMIDSLEYREHMGYQLMQRSIVDNVPAFEYASFTDILELRLLCSDELTAFRHAVRRLASSVAASKERSQTHTEILDIVQKEVTPAVADLERKIRLSRAKWVKRMVEKTTAVPTLASLVATVFAGIPLHYGLLAAAGLAGVQATLETYFDTKELEQENPYTFLIRLQARTRQSKGI